MTLFLPSPYTVICRLWCEQISGGRRPDLTAHSFPTSFDLEIWCSCGVRCTSRKSSAEATAGTESNTFTVCIKKPSYLLWYQSSLSWILDLPCTLFWCFSTYSPIDHTLLLQCILGVFFFVYRSLIIQRLPAELSPLSKNAPVYILGSFWTEGLSVWVCWCDCVSLHVVPVSEWGFSR